MMTVKTIFARFGGPAALARAIGVTTEHASTMRRRKSIPVRYWPVLLQVAKDKGIAVSESDLIEAHAAPSGENGAAA